MIDILCDLDHVTRFFEPSSQGIDKGSETSLVRSSLAKREGGEGFAEEHGLWT